MQIITFHLVTEHGPGGGNPVVRFRGPHRKMTRLVSGYLAGTSESAIEYLDSHGRVDGEGLWQLDLDVVDGMEGAAHMVAATLP